MKRESLFKRLFKRKTREGKENFQACSAMETQEARSVVKEEEGPRREDVLGEGAGPGLKNKGEGVSPSFQGSSLEEEEGGRVRGVGAGASEAERISRSSGEITAVAGLQERGEELEAISAQKKLTPKEETTLRITEGFGELSGLLKTISSKMDRENESRRELAGQLRELPGIVRQIPQATQAQTEVLRSISAQMEQQNRATQSFMERFGALPEVLKELPETARLQADVLKKMAQEMEIQNSSVSHSLNEINTASKESLASFKATQNKALNIFYKAQKETLIAFKRSQEEQARQFQRFIHSALKSNSKMLLIFFLAVMVVIAGALVLNFIVIK